MGKSTGLFPPPCHHPLSWSSRGSLDSGLAGPAPPHTSAPGGTAAALPFPWDRRAPGSGNRSYTCPPGPRSSGIQDLKNPCCLGVKNVFVALKISVTNTDSPSPGRVKMSRALVPSPADPSLVHPPRCLHLIQCDVSILVPSFMRWSMA